MPTRTSRWTRGDKILAAMLVPVLLGLLGQHHLAAWLFLVWAVLLLTLP